MCELSLTVYDTEDLEEDAYYDSEDDKEAAQDQCSRAGWGATSPGADAVPPTVPVAGPRCITGAAKNVNTVLNASTTQCSAAERGATSPGADVVPPSVPVAEGQEASGATEGQALCLGSNIYTAEELN